MMVLMYTLPMRMACHPGIWSAYIRISTTISTFIDYSTSLKVVAVVAVVVLVLAAVAARRAAGYRIPGMETLAAGINLPARSVVLASLLKAGK